MRYLPDINVWLSLTFSGHPQHGDALAWFETVSVNSCAFSRMTQQGFLRLASNPKVFKSDALSLPECWRVYDILTEDERIFYSEEPTDIEVEWRSQADDCAFSVKIWNDAYLAAFAIRAGLKLVTFDQGFRRYSGLDLLQLG
jgi:toxin-antitoxin system PIN domain toxin